LLGAEGTLGVLEVRKGHEPGFYFKTGLGLSADQVSGAGW
jgi:hypothetical protein